MEPDDRNGPLEEQQVGSGLGGEPGYSLAERYRRESVSLGGSLDGRAAIGYRERHRPVSPLPLQPWWRATNHDLEPSRRFHLPFAASHVQQQVQEQLDAPSCLYLVEKLGRHYLRICRRKHRVLRQYQSEDQSRPRGLRPQACAQRHVDLQSAFADQLERPYPAGRGWLGIQYHRELRQRQCADYPGHRQSWRSDWHRD